MFLSTDPELLFRILLAAVVGGVIGYERHNRSKVAGVRTHCIVAMASAVFTIVSLYGFDGMKSDASRVAASVVSGIGFLGAGIIFVRNDTVQGLTTAAGIWATAATGMAIGTGLYGVGATAAATVIAVQLMFRHSSYIGDLRVNMGLVIDVTEAASIRSIMDEFDRIGCSVLKAKLQANPDAEGGVQMVVVLSSAKDMEPDSVISQISALPGIAHVRLS